MILIAGPCVIESEEHTLRMAYLLTQVTDRYNVDFYFKTSWDKANRSSGGSYRGVDIQKGVRILERVKNACGCKITTDIHESWQIPPLWPVVDMFQIPALLSRQTTLIQDAAGTGVPINIKKGQFMSPKQAHKAAEKANVPGNGGIMITERGSSFGYEDLVVDMRSFLRIKDNPVPVKVIFDATHSCCGESIFVKPLAKAAVAARVDGLFVECHDDPNEALCDGHSMITPEELNGILGEIC
jgi:2-dehydro-3-deoxyphosphooctonate aldolase (KDO 8-P synthase)